MKQTSIFIAFFVFSNFAFALTAQKSYYGTQFYQSVYGQAKNEQLKTELKKILKSGHVQIPGKPDQIVETCESVKNCKTQHSIGYDGARKFIFGKFYLVKVDAANYGIREMYCDRIYQTTDFSGSQPPGPGVVPNASIINVEHTWPQSKFSNKHAKEIQKADLHHLFPTDSQMNSTRGNHIFGEVEKDGPHTKCSASRFGEGSAGSTKIFEPPNRHKGHVARALFYFSIRYDMPITPAEEIILKQWSAQFPVDDEEINRNEEIYKIQSNRNPFVDHPELTAHIGDF